MTQSWRHTVEKLEEIARRGSSGVNPAEKAVLYGAARWLIADLDSHAVRCAPELSGEIARLRSSLGAILGFESPRGYGDPQHLTWIYAASHAILRGLGDRD